MIVGVQEKEGIVPRMHIHSSEQVLPSAKLDIYKWGHDQLFCGHPVDRLTLYAVPGLWNVPVDPHDGHLAPGSGGHHSILGLDPGLAEPVEDGGAESLKDGLLVLRAPSLGLSFGCLGEDVPVALPVDARVDGNLYDRANLLLFMFRLMAGVRHRLKPDFA